MRSGNNLNVKNEKKKILNKRYITLSLFFMHTITQNSHTSSEGNLPNSFLHTVVKIVSKYHFSIKSYAVLNESHRMNKSIVLCHKFMIISILQRNDTHARYTQ